MPKTFIIVKTQFQAFHNWPNAPEEVKFLRNPHRHIFYVTVKFIVHHDDRDKEFFIEKRKLDNFLSGCYGPGLMTGKSCEMLCKEIADYSKADFVSVFEDNENGAEYYRTYEHWPTSPKV